ncbi:MAG: anion permease, partial [Candidatus Eremiobacteraeota bacterium]|nr:anion permease [Candidatus Eremiobacteraeota bacterium]
GGVALVLLGCLTPDEAYSSIEWRAIVLIAAMSPMAIALERTGWTDIVGKSLAGTLSYGPLALVAAFFLSTAALAQVLGGQVTALLAGPITVGIALKLGLDPVGIGVLVAIACSNAFLTPVSHPVNALVMGPGGYKSTDFVKVGAGLMVVTFTTAMLMAHFYWGF